MALFTKIVHYSFDLALLSGFLAGVKRNTGLTPKLDFLDSQPELRKIGDRYLNFGEWLLDSSAATMSSSEYFVRK
ncbi:hypothetical protein PACTADRAFT_50621 [Pachysolen tannophilus NRRL Y-2460]|uniref:DUF1748-domain-containing protein n=1 Tax=Pachysolen tannophilus NRRL Y-2460 TaxID=669874 RepID=A0A1E4TSN8_PACTA|nr:hypothetical protein PACTADRAFT_50621 [Pachysolen tannophilus NRRL Y-2460]